MYTCTELAAPPPTPILYTGPPNFTICMPFSGRSFSVILESIKPNPQLNIIGLIHSRRSLVTGSTSPKVLANPANTGSPNLFP